MLSIMRKINKLYIRIIIFMIGGVIAIEKVDGVLLFATVLVTYLLCEIENVSLTLEKRSEDHVE